MMMMMMMMIIIIIIIIIINTFFVTPCIFTFERDKLVNLFNQSVGYFILFFIRVFAVLSAFVFSSSLFYFSPSVTGIYLEEENLELLNTSEALAAL